MNGSHEVSNETDELYGDFETADGRLVVYDTGTPTAWIMTDTTMPITP